MPTVVPLINIAIQVKLLHFFPIVSKKFARLYNQESLQKYNLFICEKKDHAHKEQILKFLLST